ncbi:hypothetical protein FKP32DRAFT_1606039, partial [Trametes sanguinea]
MHITRSLLRPPATVVSMLSTRSPRNFDGSMKLRTLAPLPSRSSLAQLVTNSSESKSVVEKFRTVHSQPPNTSAIPYMNHSPFMRVRSETAHLGDVGIPTPLWYPISSNSNLSEKHLIPPISSPEISPPRGWRDVPSDAAPFATMSAETMQSYTDIPACCCCGATLTLRCKPIRSGLPALLFMPEEGERSIHLFAAQIHLFLPARTKRVLAKPMNFHAYIN